MNYENVLELMQNFKKLFHNKHVINILTNLVYIDDNDTLIIPTFFYKNYKIKNVYVIEISKNHYRFSDIFLNALKNYLDYKKVNYKII